MGSLLPFVQEVMGMSKESLRVDDDFQEIGTRSIDDRKRLTLGDLLEDFKRVRLYRNKRGELLLKPIVEIPADELWLYRNKEAATRVDKGLKDAAEGKVSKLDLKEL